MHVISVNSFHCRISLTRWQNGHFTCWWTVNYWDLFFWCWLKWLPKHVLLFKKNYVCLVMNCFVWGKMSFHCICVNIFFYKRNCSLSLQVLITICSCERDEVHMTWKVLLMSLVFEIYPRIVTVLFSRFYCVYAFFVISVIIVLSSNSSSSSISSSSSSRSGMVCSSSVSTAIVTFFQL